MKTQNISMYDGDSLSCLIKQLDKLGIKKEDYDKVKIELDYSGCCYEGETPSIKAIIK